MSLTDGDGRSRVQEWIDERAKSKLKRDCLCETLSELILPVLRDWVAQRPGDDPITGNPVFSMHAGTSPGERPSSSAFVSRASVEAFDGSTIEFEVPPGRAVIRVTGSVGSARDYVAIRAASTDATPSLEKEDGSLTAVTVLLTAFERAVLQSPLW